MAGEDGIIALDNKTEEIISFCDICLAEYRDSDTLQYMIEEAQAAEEEMTPVCPEGLPQWLIDEMKQNNAPTGLDA